MIIASCHRAQPKYTYLNTHLHNITNNITCYVYETNCIHKKVSLRWETKENLCDLLNLHFNFSLSI